MTLIVHSIISFIYLDGNGGGVGLFEGDLFISGHLEKVRHRLSNSYEMDENTEGTNAKESPVCPVADKSVESWEDRGI